MAKTRKPSVAIPPIPAGAIADLPPLTRDEKVAQLAALLERTQRELAAHINEISTRVVFGEGDPDAPIMFIGEGPGIEEDRTGRPFVGKSGQLLDKQIGAMKYQRSQVFIANIVKLRAADYSEAEGRVKDRPPTPDEVARQIHILHEQIAIIRPKVIVTLGAPAIKWLLSVTEGVMKIRGTWLDYRGLPVMPTYHPAFLLRSYTEENRRKVWEDLQKVMALLKGE
jgi:DNA polymerase